MKLKFRIEENFEEILKKVTKLDCGIVVDGTIEKTERKNHFHIQDEYFNSHSVLVFDEKSIGILTAWSGFKYEISQKKGITYCAYEGAFMGLLEQNLMLKITPAFTGEEMVESTDGVTSLKKYVVERRKQCLEKELVNPKGFHPTPHCLKDLFPLTEEDKVVTRFKCKKQKVTTLGDVFKEKLNSVLYQN